MQREINFKDRPLFMKRDSIALHRTFDSKQRAALKRIPTYIDEKRPIYMNRTLFL